MQTREHRNVRRLDAGEVVWLLVKVQYSGGKRIHERDEKEEWKKREDDMWCSVISAAPETTYFSLLLMKNERNGEK